MHTCESTDLFSKYPENVKSSDMMTLCIRHPPCIHSPVNWYMNIERDNTLILPKAAVHITCIEKEEAQIGNSTPISSSCMLLTIIVYTLCNIFVPSNPPRDSIRDLPYAYSQCMLMICSSYPQIIARDLCVNSSSLSW